MREQLPNRTSSIEKTVTECGPKLFGPFSVKEFPIVDILGKVRANQDYYYALV